METFHEQKAPSGAAPAARPDITQALTQGVVRLFLDLGLSPLTEFRLPSGRRVDVAGLDSKGRLAFAEIKSGVEDFEADQKWPDYLGYCDAFYFAVSRDFPQALLPASEGVILADQFGGAVVRGPASRSMAPARRKSIMLRFARVAAGRLWTA